MYRKVKLIIPIVFFFLIFTQVPLTSIHFSFNKSDTSLKIELISLSAYTPEYNITWGGSSEDYGWDIALDTLGNIYIAGGTWSFDSGGGDAYYTKYNSTGDSLLNVTWGGSLYDSAEAIALDDAGNVYLAGTTYSFGAGSLAAFVAKFNTSGDSVLNITWGGSFDDDGYDIVLDDLGNIYITGYTWSFGAGNTDAFIAKYDSSGNSLLNITWGGISDDFGYGITLDQSGNIYITGLTYSFASVNTQAFIAKFDSSGNSLLNITWGGEFDESGFDLALDNSGNIYMTGETDSFGGLDYEAFIAKFDALGNSILNITWESVWNDAGRDIALDDSRNIYITGTTRNDAFVAKYDNSGNTLLNLIWAGTADDDGMGIALDDSNNIYITGKTQSMGAGGNDAFVAKYTAKSNNNEKLDDDDDDDKVSETLPYWLWIIILLVMIGVVITLFLLKKYKIPAARQTSKKQKRISYRTAKSEGRKTHKSSDEPAQPSNYYYSYKNQIDKKLLNFIFNQNKQKGIIKHANLPAEMKQKYDYCIYKVVDKKVVVKGIVKKED